MIYGLWHGSKKWTEIDAHKWRWYPNMTGPGDWVFSELNEVYMASQKKTKDFPECVYEVRGISNANQVE